MTTQPGEIYGTKYSRRRLRTPLKRSDLVLPEQALEQLEEIEHWFQHNDTLMDEWGMRGKVRPGFRVLFQGPSGTGKTMAASLLGKSTGTKVFQIGLSPTVSKYIGETEKNLEKLFAKAERNQWILLFDEADALFGKRSEVKDSHDRFANLETSYLLQRIESYSGLAILSSNLTGTFDDALLRRIQSVITFPLPDSSARLKLWEQAFPGKAKLAANVDLMKLAESHEIGPASIMCIARNCCLRALAQGTETIKLEDIEVVVQRELN